VLQMEHPGLSPAPPLLLPPNEMANDNFYAHVLAPYVDAATEQLKDRIQQIWHP